MRFRYGELLRSIPIIGITTFEILVRVIKRCESIIAGIKIWQVKRHLVKDAEKHYKNIQNLDVSLIGNYYVFHNKSNSLIKFGLNYEPEVHYALKTLINFKKLKSDHVIFADISENIGLHSIFVLNSFPSTEIIAFDPSPNSYDYLKLTMKYNKIEKIRLKKIALSEKNGEMDFFTWGANSSGDSFKDTKRLYREIKPKIIKVKSSRLDDLYDMPPLDVIKIDTEGSELEILRGAINTIKKNKPFIVLEFHKKNRAAFKVSTSQIFEFLKNIKFSIFSINFELLSAETFESIQEKYISEDFILLPEYYVKSLSF